MAGNIDRYAPSRRLAELRELLDATGGLSAYEISERMSVSVPTARRYVRALEAAGEPVVEETVGKRKVWSLMPGARKSSVTLTTSQMVSLFLSRRVFDFLDGTGFKEDLDDVFSRLEKALKRKDVAYAKNLDRKFFDVNEAPYKYSGRMEDVDAIITALIREDRLRVTHERTSRWQKPFTIDPYSLFVYKKGLYLAGHSHHHEQVRLFSIDGFRDVEWLKGDRFEYPADYRPEKLVEGVFGLIAGQPTRVRIFFDKEVARFVRRRTWHPSQKIKSVPGGIEFSMEVRGTVEVENWVLSYGGRAEVLEPEELRDKIGAELEAAVALYRTKAARRSSQRSE